MFFERNDINEANTEKDTLLTSEQVCRMLQIKPDTLRHWCSQKRIPHYKFSASMVRFRRSDIEEWILEKYAGPSKENTPENTKVIRVKRRNNDIEGIVERAKKAVLKN